MNVEPGAEGHREPGAPGIIDSIKSTIATILQILHTRLELITTELQEEMHRVGSVVLWGAVALFAGGLFVMMAAITILIAVGEEHRLLAAMIITGVFLASLLIALGLMKSRLGKRTRLLAASLDELKRDRDALRRSTHGGTP